MGDSLDGSVFVVHGIDGNVAVVVFSLVVDHTRATPQVVFGTSEDATPLTFRKIANGTKVLVSFEPPNLV